MKARYYDPVALRFLSPDPVYVDSGTGGNFNRYWYANNNPYTYTDPDGRHPTGTRIDPALARQRYESIGGGHVVRVDKFNNKGESAFEVHIYKDSPEFREAAAARDSDALRNKHEVNTLDQDGSWGKHGKAPVAPDLGPEGQAGFNRVVHREVAGRGWTTKGESGKTVMREDVRKNIGRFGKFLGPAGVLLETTRSSVERLCEVDQENDAC